MNNNNMLEQFNLILEQKREFLVIKPSKYTPNSIWTKWDNRLRRPDVLKQVSKANSFDEICEIIERYRIKGIGDRSIIHTAAHLANIYDKDIDDNCWNRCLIIDRYRKAQYLQMQYLGGLNYLQKAYAEFKNLNNIKLFCIYLMFSQELLKQL